jgi:DNA uptake protein ComE-like DNA-binding protein
VSNRNKWDSNTSAGREVDSGSFETRRQEWKNYQRKEWQSVDLNSCDSTALEALPGIGAASARAIIRYRERLGGFRSVNQLSEIKALRSENLQTALPYLYADTSRLNRFCLNTCTAEEMRRHPYISYKVANSIAAMREQHGTYRRLADIKKSVLVNDSIYERICDYFSLCHPDD